MSLPIGVVLGVTNITYQTYQSVNLASKVLVSDNEGRILHRASPFAVPKAESLSSGATDGMVLNANIKTCAISAFATLAHTALSFPKHPMPLTHLGATAIKCNKFLGIAGLLSMVTNLYFQNKLSHKAVMNDYLDGWAKQTAEMKSEWAKEKKA